jgi:hypothetical protein
MTMTKTRAACAVCASQRSPKNPRGGGFLLRHRRNAEAEELGSPEPRAQTSNKKPAGFFSCLFPPLIPKSCRATKARRGRARATDGATTIKTAAGVVGVGACVLSTDGLPQHHRQPSSSPVSYHHQYPSLFFLLARHATVDVALMKTYQPTTATTTTTSTSTHRPSRIESIKSGGARPKRVERPGGLEGLMIMPLLQLAASSSPL